MKNRLSFSLLAIVYTLMSCDANEASTSSNDLEPAGTETSKPASGADPNTPITEKRFEGKGITYILREDKSLGESVSRITILATDSTHTDSLNLGDKDPVQSGLLADLDENDHDELYLVTRSAGSGTYAHIFGFMRDEENKLAAIEVPQVGPSDQTQGKKFEGYMGHDSVHVDGHSLVRKYPVFRPGDTNDNPSGGMKEIRYTLAGNRLEAE